MKEKRLALFSLLVASLLLVGTLLMKDSAAQAGSGWLPFDGASEPASPEVALLSASPKSIELQASLPGVYAETIWAGGQPFTRMTGEGYGFSTTEGAPELRVVRQEVEIPYGALVSIELGSAQYREVSLTELGLHTIYPLQPPQVKLAGAETPPFTLDAEAYSQGGFSPSSPVSIGEVYIVRGHRILLVEVWPVAYDPVAGTLRLYSEVIFRLQLQGSNMDLTSAMSGRYASPEFDQSLSQRVLNYNQGLGMLEADEVGYLIITADAYYDAILPLATLRESRGFTVTVTRLSELTGSTNQDIKSYIQIAYDTWAIPPSYVLLVGDTDTIPTWIGPRILTTTDLYYGTMDGEEDWHPDIYRGRFPVRTAEQTTYMVDKYLAYANLMGVEPWLKTVSLPATCDTTFYPVAEATQNYVVEAYTQPGGWTGIFPNNPNPGGDQLYCVTYGAATQNLIDAFNQGRWAIIYSGHGEFTGWEMGFDPNDVRNLKNYGMFPVVISHACMTGDFAQDEVFGETWVLQYDRGALAYFGASTLTNWPHDDILERGYIDYFFSGLQPPPDLGTMLEAGMVVLELQFSGQAQYVREAYNLLGDPAVKLFLQPDLPTFTLQVTPDSHEVCVAGEVSSTVEVDSALDYAETVYLDYSSPSSYITASYEPSSATAPFTSTFTLDITPGALYDFSIDINASDDMGLSHSTSVDLLVVSEAPEAPILMAPLDASFDQPLRPQFRWLAVPYTRSLRLQLADSATFENILLDVSGLETNNYLPASPLEQGSCYWWRMNGNNACGDGEWRAPFHFATLILDSAFWDDIESGEVNWSHMAVIGDDNWEISTDQAYSPTHAWYVPNDNMITDTSLWNTVPVLLQPDSTLSFWHQYKTEYDYDGGVIEVSTDGGSTWSDLGTHITANGYTGMLSTEYENPLGGRMAWTGNLIEWTEVTVDLSSFAGQSVNIRWRMGCDSSLGADGWYIDDIRIASPSPLASPPTISLITPLAGMNDRPTEITITGAGFSGTPSVRLGDIWLEEVVLVDSSTISALVPSGLLPGAYYLQLFNGDCQEIRLEDAFTVTEDVSLYTVYMPGVLK